MRIAIDAFGGDNAPEAILEGCARALAKFSDVSLLITGDEDVVKRVLLSHGGVDMSRVEVRHASSVITNNEHPVSAIKQKKDASLVIALDALAQKEADAFVSAGSTGAVLAGATLIVRRIKGVMRPALAPFLPTDGSNPVLLVDCGANVDCKPAWLEQFALMGSVYVEALLGIKNPRVGLINNGSEAEKGNELTKAAYPLLEKAPINFRGNAEGRYIVSGDFDIVVCDGFAGNIVLKFMEGVAQTLFSMLKRELMSGPREKIGALLAKPAFKRLNKRVDYAEYGGALLLGIDGCVIKAHGSSDAKAFCAAINQAREFVLSGTLDKIRKSMDQQ